MDTPKNNLTHGSSQKTFGIEVSTSELSADFRSIIGRYNKNCFIWVCAWIRKTTHTPSNTPKLTPTEIFSLLRPRQRGKFTEKFEQSYRTIRNILRKIVVLPTIIKESVDIYWITIMCFWMKFIQRTITANDGLIRPEDVWALVFLQVHLFVCLSVCLLFCLSVCLSIYLFVYLAVCLSVVCRVFIHSSVFHTNISTWVNYERSMCGRSSSIA